jgi:hypothetical protein
MFSIRLQEAEWNQVISIIAQSPWTVANPLLIAITRQLQEQKAPQQQINLDGVEAEPPPTSPGRH